MEIENPGTDPAPRGRAAFAAADMLTLNRRFLDRLQRRVVGRKKEMEVVVAALAAKRHVLLEGPPGTGKSTILRAIALEAELGFEFVEGNAELTPARLVGHFDPATGLWAELPGGVKRRIMLAMDMAERMRPVELIDLPLGRIEQ